MPARIIKLVLFLAVVAVVSYLYIQNPNPITVVLSSSRQWTAPLALVLTVTFTLGIVITAAIALYYGTRSSFSRWLERRKFDAEREQWNRITRVREMIASGRDDRACDALQRIIQDNPKNLLARAMYADCLRRLRHYNEALMTLDEARASFSENVELPLSAAAIHLERGNATAAYDNVQLVLQHDPENAIALKLAKECADKLGYHAKSAEITERIIRTARAEDRSLIDNELAAIQLRQINEDHSSPSPERKKKLEQLQRQYREFVPTYEALAELESVSGNRDAAARLYAKAYSLDSGVNHLEHLAKIWLSSEPAKAVSAVHGLILTQEENEGYQARSRLFFIQLLLHLDMVDDAKKEADALQLTVSKNKDDSTLRDPLLAKELAFAQARIADRHDKIEAALDGLMKSIANESIDPFLRGDKSSSKGTLLKLRHFDAPSPRLSTP